MTYEYIHSQSLVKSSGHEGGQAEGKKHCTNMQHQLLCTQVYLILIFAGSSELSQLLLAGQSETTKKEVISTHHHPNEQGPLTICRPQLRGGQESQQ